MQALNTLTSMPFATKLAVWLFAFFSPTACFLALLFGPRLIPGLPQSLVVVLFCAAPVAALLVCESLVWSSRMRGGRKIVGMVLTLLACTLQFTVLVIILRVIVVTAIAYP